VRVIDSVEDGNPGSTDQVKEWLHNLGWKPKTFKYVRDKATGKERMIEQVRSEGELCESVTDLIDKDSAVGILEGLTVITHRLGIFKAFLNSHKDGWLEAGIDGITNTFRFKHKNPIVNLPGIDKPWGKEIRGCLLPPEGHVWAGSDMVSLEATTRNHYIQPLDPRYVEEMVQPGYDPHLKIAVIAGKITEADYTFYKDWDEISDPQRYKDIKAVRKKAKTVSYSAMYGVGAAKLAREIESSKKDAQELLDGFWKLNWAIKAVAGKQKVKIVGGKMWLQNPVSGFWHSLRAEKDIWSTLNQSTGVYCFDTWVGYLRVLGAKLAFTFHDEVGCPVEIGSESFIREVLSDAIAFTNKKLFLNVKLGIDIQFGDNYAKIH
ncbi:DNA-directed DNA polymerase, family A, palm domain containing protein, partial [uncultured Caudovirales phage]